MHSLRWRMFVMVFVVVAAAVGTVSALAGQGTTEAVQDMVFMSARRDEHIATQLLASAPGSAVLPDDWPSVETRAAAVGQVMGTALYLVNQRGLVVFDSNHSLTGRAVEVPPQWPGPNDTPVLVGDEQAFVVVGYAPLWQSPLEQAPGEPVPDQARRWLEAELSSDQSPITSSELAPSLQAQAILGDFQRTLLLAAVAGGGVALVLTGGLSRGIVGPVEALTAAVRRMERGDRNLRVEVRSRDEIGELAGAFNAMADSINTAERLRRQMVTDIAHELRTPLTNVRGYLEAVRDGMLDASPAVIDSLYEESMLLNRLVADLQELALAEAGQLRLERQPMAMADLITRAVTALTPHLANGPAVAVDAPADLPPVHADPERVSQVLRNLLTNALHYTPPESTITIAARAVPGAVEVTVRDEGRGIAPEHLPFIFDRFYRADPARARATGGAGLGLAIVKQLVEAHGGQVRVESAPGQGAIFAFTLPAASGD